MLEVDTLSALTAGLWGGLAAFSLIAGAVLAIRLALPNRVIGAVMGFGSGALISSLAYELVPESLLGHGELGLALAFALGALTFFVASWAIDKAGGAHRKRIGGSAGGGSGSAIFLGTLLDGLPESLVLGIGLAMGGSVSIAFLFAVFISNVPEGIAGTRSMLAGGVPASGVLGMWSALVLMSAVAAAVGFQLVHWMPSIDARYFQAFAGGAVLTMLADVMMPEAFEHGGKIVGLLATFGYLTAGILSVVK